MAESIHDQIVALYGHRILRRSALSIRAGAGVFKRVLEGKGYGTALEIGTHRGVAAAEMAQYVDQVVTIDLKFGRLEQLGETFNREAFWESLGISNILSILVDNDAQKASIVQRLRFDFAFIDGAHDTASVALDFELVKRCGRVLFHDYDRRGVRGKDDVCDFVDALPKDEVEILDIFALWTK